MQIETVDYQAADAPEKLARSLRQTGFAVLVNHPILPSRINEAYALWGAFFASDEKTKYLRDYEKQDGYFPFKSEHAKDAPKKDLKEFYHVYPWGKMPDDLKTFTRDLYDDLTTIGIKLLSWLDQQMPADTRKNLSMPLQDMMTDSDQSLLRIAHYPPIGSDEDAAAIRAAAHEDINLITLLLAGSQPGLQARDKQGQWHNVTCDPGMITINNGDMLSVATNRFFPSTTHRVVNPDDKRNLSRYSMPMFLHPRPDVKLGPDLTAAAFLQERLKEIGLKS